MRIARTLPLILLLTGSVLGQDRDDVRKARLALRKGEYEAALRMFEHLSESKPAAWDPRAGWVRALLETGRRAEATAVCESYLKEHANHAGAILALAQVALEDGDPKRALSLLGPIEEGVRARALGGRILEELERVEDASQRTKPLIELFNKSRDEFMKEDLFWLAQGLAIHARTAGSADLYKQVVQVVLPDLLKVDPQDASIHTFLGVCFLEKYNQSAAAESFKEALQANPHFVPALAGLGRLLLSAHDAASALKLATHALEINPSSEEAHALMARILFIQKNRPGAIAALDKGLETNPRSVRLLSLRAAVRTVGGDPDAGKDADRAKALQPETVLPDWETGRLYLESGERQFDEAQRLFNRAVERNARIPDLLIDTGLNALRVGDEERARKVLSAAFARDPFNVRVVNSVNLLRDLEKDFVLLEPPHFRVRLDRRERRWQEAEVLGLLDRAWTEMTRRYHFTPADPVLVEVFPLHSDFSVRTMGIPGLGALGACFGRVVTTLGPRSRIPDADLPPFCWGEVLWHEMAHVFSLQLSGYRVPSWFTEGLATYEEALGFRNSRRESGMEILLGRHRGDVTGVGTLESGKPAGNPILTVYLQGAEICRFIAEKKGFDVILQMLKGWASRKTTEEVFRGVLGQTLEEFDHDFLAWLDGRLARYRFRRPEKSPVETLLAEATADPKSASASARLALALLDTGDDAGAETYGSRAVESDPKNPLAHAAYGQALLRRRQPEEAIPHLEKGTDDFQNWDALGRALAQVRRWRESAEAFHRAADAMPLWYPDAAGQTVQYRLNGALLEMKDYAGAQEALEAMVAADPLDFRDRLKLARIYLEKPDLARMSLALAEASAIETRDLDLLDLEAAYHRARKEYDQSIERTMGAIALLEVDGKDEDGIKRAERWCAAGEDWLARGDRVKAAELAQEALRFSSGFERARKLYEASHGK
jgi:Tfp pilus assembly protein PilF